MDKTLQFFMVFVCLSVVNVGGRGGGGIWTIAAARPSVTSFQKLDFPMVNPVKNKHRDKYK